VPVQKLAVAIEQRQAKEPSIFANEAAAKSCAGGAPLQWRIFSCFFGPRAFGSLTIQEASRRLAVRKIMTRHWSDAPPAQSYFWYARTRPWSALVAAIISGMSLPDRISFMPLPMYIFNRSSE
jgi:hypothetical protein